MTHKPDLLPVWVRLPQAPAICGLSRSEIYRQAGRGKIEMKKCGKTSLVKISDLLQVVESLPSAIIRPPARLRASEAAAPSASETPAA